MSSITVILNIAFYLVFICYSNNLIIKCFKIIIASLQFINTIYNIQFNIIQ